MKKHTFIVIAFTLALTLGMFTACSNGVDGTSITWKGTYQSADDPALGNPEYLWAYYNSTDGCSYVWNGSKWEILSGSKEKTFDVTPVDNQSYTVKKVNFRILNEDLNKAEDSPLLFMSLIFFTGKEEIPYVPLLSDFLAFIDSDSKYTIPDLKKDSTSLKITNETNNTSAVLDLSKHTLFFENYDAFFQCKNEKLYNDLGSSNNSDVDYMKIDNVYNIAGQPVTLDWSSQDIGVMLCQDDEDAPNNYFVAIPLQFFNDIFLAKGLASVLYNGKHLYFDSLIKNNKTMADDYYDAATGVRSQVLADFCYNELCLNLDFNYGLKAIHGIEDFPDFDTYFICLGIKDKLKSTDPKIFANALCDVCDFYFGDGHSNYLKNSYYLGNVEKIEGVMPTSQMDRHYDSLTTTYYGARRKAYNKESGDNSTPGYEVSSDGKTAIVRFDEFVYNGDTKEKRAANITELEANSNYITNYTSTYESKYDTLTLIQYANKKIKEDAKIENVVLDLSCNGGGAIHAAYFVNCWMLGEFDMSITNPITGAKCGATYETDVNGDGQYDFDDTVKNKNLFCLVSPLSFSCGNLVPAALKASDKVTILGVTSGGGTASVQPSSTADGTMFRMSSKYVSSVSKNGSNYNVDQGVEPHYYINKPANFFNKETISALVNNINSGTFTGN